MIYLGADKNGQKAIQIVEEFLNARNIEFANLGIQKDGEDSKLEDLIPKVVAETVREKNNQAILSCGTGVGAAVGANKFAGIRACLATDEKVAEYSRVYDDCNVLCLVGWDPDPLKIQKILHVWLTSQYDGSEKRLKMFDVFNSWGGKL